MGTLVTAATCGHRHDALGPADPGTPGAQAQPIRARCAPRAGAGLLPGARARLPARGDRLHRALHPVPRPPDPRGRHRARGLPRLRGARLGSRPPPRPGAGAAARSARRRSPSRPWRALYLLALPVLFERAIAWPVAAKIALSLALIAPLAIPMGMPFPLGLRRAGREDPDLVPWAWGRQRLRLGRLGAIARRYWPARSASPASWRSLGRSTWPRPWPCRGARGAVPFPAEA